MPVTRSVTRDDVARRAGVSPGLVSYVLNEGPRQVSADKRARILAAIDELGYRRDAAARQLRTGKSQLIGLVLPDVRLPYFADITELLSELLFDEGFQLLVGSSSWRLEQENGQLRSLFDRRVDGVILMSVDPLQDFEAVLNGPPVVIVDRPSVTVGSSEMATRHLRRHGYERIAFVEGPPNVVATDRSRRGWSQALEATGLTPADELVYSAAASLAGGYEAGLRLLRSAEPPRAVCVQFDTQAVGLLKAASDLGVRVAEDLAVVTCDGTEVSAFTTPRLSTIEHPVRTIAEDAVRAVLEPRTDQIRRLTNLEFGLVERESCGCPGLS